VRTLLTVDRKHLNAWKWRAFAVGLTGWAISLMVLLGDPGAFFRAYLPAYLFFWGLTLGSTVLLMIYHLTGGAWGFLIRRTVEASARTLPLMALLFLPIAFGLNELYPWAKWTANTGNHAQRHVYPYLNETWFRGRAFAYFAIWLAVTYSLERISRQQERESGGRLTPRLRTLSGLGLLAYGIGMNFASVDWVMSLQFPFHSTIFGPLMASGHLLSALAFSLCVLAWLSKRPPVASVISPDAINDLGSLLFAFVVVWSYMIWFQFMLIWIANLPTDVMWYVPRSHGVWKWVAWTLFVFGFLVPLFLLLPRSVKRNTTALFRLSLLILAMQLTYAAYLVMPSYSISTGGSDWMILVTPLGVGGLWVACFLRQFGRFEVLPRHDFNQNEALRLRQIDEENTPAESELVHG